MAMDTHTQAGIRLMRDEYAGLENQTPSGNSKASG